LLIGLGAHELSMAPPAIPEVRFVLRHSTKEELTQLAQRALALSECTAIKALLADYAATKLKLR